MIRQTRPASFIKDGAFLEYREVASSSPDTTVEATSRFTFSEELPGRFNVSIDSENIEKYLYTVAYGEKILVDENLMTPQDIPLQYAGLCPLLVTQSQISGVSDFRWPWDGAGLEPVSLDPEERLYGHGRLHGPVKWNRWEVLVLDRTDIQLPTPAPVGYYEKQTGILVGIEYGADEGNGSGRFIYCDALLVKSNLKELGT